ncbi:MAG: hypothetical protein PHD37_05245 [Gallionellaceae bacterium]|nr:hypothetical protein [Gallionellaceae bacterium]
MKTTLTLFALGLTALTSLPASAESETWIGTLYHNDGHFGAANSDVNMEQAEPIIAGAPSSEVIEPETAPTRTWNGTLYRNGGYYGDKNSDERLENTP